MFVLCHECGKRLDTEDEVVWADKNGQTENDTTTPYCMGCLPAQEG